MEFKKISEDISTLCLEAHSFPDGIMDAHEELHSLLNGTGNRIYFGISRPENGKITYWAAAKELKENEAEEFKLKRIVLKSGEYICESITGYQADPSIIESTFQKLLKYPYLDPEGYCVERYINKTDVDCMIRVSEKK